MSFSVRQAANPDHLIFEVNGKEVEVEPLYPMRYLLRNIQAFSENVMEAGNSWFMPWLFRKIENDMYVVWDGDLMHQVHVAVFIRKTMTGEITVEICEEIKPEDQPEGFVYHRKNFQQPLAKTILDCQQIADLAENLHSLLRRHKRCND